MTARGNSLERARIDFEYQEDESDFKALTNRIKEKRRLKKLKARENESIKYTPEWYASESKKQLKELPNKYK